MTPEQTTRFWSKVDKSGECWTWTGAHDRRGYGWFKRDRKMVKAHRLSWEMVHGPIQDGMFCCHHCDNPKCIRPGHLFLGTPRDNMRDMVAKGRHSRVRGEKVNGAKLTEAKVIACHQRKAAGESTSAIAKSLGVHKHTVDLLLRGKTWPHLFPTSPLADPAGAVTGVGP